MFEKIKKWWNGEDETVQMQYTWYMKNTKHWTSRPVHWLISLFVNPEKRAIFLAVLGFITFSFMLLKYFSSTNT